MVYQHFKLVQNYTVTENIVLGMEPTKMGGILDLASASKRVSDLSNKSGLAVDPSSIIEEISGGQQ